MQGFYILLFYALIAVAILTFGLLLWARSSLSRKSYRCPKCHEVVQVELMNATRCNVCGAPLDRDHPDIDRYHEDDDATGP